MTFTTTLSTPTAPTPASPAAERSMTLEARLHVALEHARRLTAMYGVEAREVALAWDTVEDLWTAQRRQRTQTPFERYCEAYPDAPAARMYEV
ncbi:MAG: hypothetical protein RLZZ597_2904 [Cyanobacteriota bacterium]|jgi:hypothetical protein